MTTSLLTTPMMTTMTINGEAQTVGEKPMMLKMMLKTKAAHIFNF